MSFERQGFRGWPSRKPVWRIAAVVGALLVFALGMVWQYKYRWTALEKVYVGQYVFGDGKLHLLGGPTYTFVYRVEGKSRRVAVNDDLLDPALDRQKVKFEWGPPEKVQGARFGAWARAAIYGGRSPWESLADPAWKIALAFLVVAFPFAWQRDRRRQKLRKYGRRLRGPERVTPEEFRERLDADGIFLYGPALTGLGRLWARLQRRPQMPLVQIPRAKEANHILLMGDSGSGKGVSIEQMLWQIRKRDECAIVYDPALEYLPRFYDPERDTILNPLDARMPYWSPGDELRSAAEAPTLAKSLFPDQGGQQNRFFVETPRKIMAHLLSLRPTVEQLTDWLCRPIEIDRRVQGTELAAMIDPSAPSQRAGVLSSLNLIADALKRLPTRDEAEGSWTAAEWAANPRGWIFITSTPDTRDAVLPLISFFLDTLVLRLMTQAFMESRREKPVWFVLDEIATLQRLPQLHTAITENRKTGNPVVLAFQGRSQMEARYGEDAEAMLSQPATKIFLRTTEPDAAEWISRAIGEVEIERIHESRTDGRFPADRHSKNDAIEIRQEMLVLSSQVAGLPDLRGYIKTGNLVTDLSLKPMGLPARHPKFIERPERSVPARPSDPAPPPSTPAAPALALAPERSPKLKPAVGQTPTFD